MAGREYTREGAPISFGWTEMNHACRIGISHRYALPRRHQTQRGKALSMEGRAVCNKPTVRPHLHFSGIWFSVSIRAL